MTSWTKIAACCAALLAGLNGPARAQDVPDDLVRAELRDGWVTETGARMTALHLTLAPGWKTYWRVPGAAGIPPRFDWSGSDNLRTVAYHWPRPEVIAVGGMRTLGYHGELVLPIEIRPADPARPLVARAEIELGVCRDICVPVTLDLTATFAAGSPGAPDPLIRQALSRVPESAAEAGLVAARCEVTPIRDGMRLSSRLTLPALGAEEFAVVELADRSVWVSETETARAGGDLLTTADLVPPSAAPFALDRSQIRFTLFSGNGRVVDVHGCTG